MFGKILEIKTQKTNVIMRPFTLEEYMGLYLFANETNLTKYLTRKYTAQEKFRQIYFDLADNSDTSTHSWGIEVAGKLIGLTKIKGIKPHIGFAETDLKIYDISNRGQGIGFAVHLGRIYAAVDILKLNTLWVGIYSGNGASIHNCLKVGYVPTGTEYGSYTEEDGSIGDYLHFQWFNPENVEKFRNGNIEPEIAERFDISNQMLRLARDSVKEI